MKTYPIIRKIESGSYLSNSKDININFTFKNNTRTLIKGLVINSKGVPLPNVGLEVCKLNKITKEKVMLGIIFTDINGEYAISIEIIPNYDYLFTAYSAI